MIEWYIQITSENRDEIIEYVRQRHSRYLNKFSFSLGSFMNIVIFGDITEEVYCFTSISEEDKDRLCSSMDEIKHEMLNFSLTL